MIFLNYCSKEVHRLSIYSIIEKNCIDSREIQAWISIGFVYQKMMKFNDALKCYKKAQSIIGNRYHHKLYDGLASCLTKLSLFDEASEVYQQIFQREEGKKKWDAQRSLKFVNKLKRKKAVGTLQALVPQDESLPKIKIDLPKPED